MNTGLSAASFRQVRQGDQSWDVAMLVVMSVNERELSWVIGLNTRKYAETGNTLHAMFGSGPMVISKATSQFVVTDSAPPLHKQILRAEKSLGIENEN